MKPGTQPGGARYVSIRSKSRLVHHLVLLAFVGPCAPGLECCHADDDKSNNALSNLRWDTHAANCADAIRNGKQVRGERHGHSKFTADTIRSIRADYATGLYSQRDLARKYHCGQIQISRIVTRKQWAHII